MHVLGRQAFHNFCERRFCLAKRHAILRAFRTGDGGLDAAKVQFERVIKERRRRLVRAEKHLLLAISFHESNLFRLPPSKSQISECLRIDREKAHGRAVFRGHVGDSGAVGNAQAGKTGAVELDELSDHAFLAQHLSHGQHEVRCGCPFAQTPVQAKADDLWNEHRGWLAEHGSFGLNSADAPAKHAKRIHHRRVRIGSDNGIRISFPIVAVRHGADDACQVFKVHLMTDPRIRRYNFEILKRGLAPAQKRVAFDVPLEFQLRVQSESVNIAEIVHLHGMVDDQFRGEEGVDALGVAAHFHERLAHRSQIHDRRHAREVLQKNAGRHERNLFFRNAGPPPRQGLNVLGMDEAAVFAAKQVFEKNSQGEGKLCEFRDALFFEDFEAMHFKRLGADVELVARAEGIPRVDGHPCDPFAVEAAFYDNRNRIRAPRSYTNREVNIVLISTYELGRQPFGLASPAAWLRERGHQVTALDLTRQPLEEAAIRAAALIAIYLPMHTATRLAAQLIPTLRRLNPRAHLCSYGLYAPMNAEYLHSLGVSTILGGEFEDGLAHLAERLSANWNGSYKSNAPQPEPLISLARQKFIRPDRHGLPLPSKYAHVILPSGEHRATGYTEASRGCKHLCRHCPIVPVYNGVFRIVDREIVLEDIRQQVGAGARHITFGDPDFFNGLGHATALVEALHREFPQLTYDVTIKVEHLLKHKKHLPELRDTGCLFVTSAVESVDDEVLRRLDKGHTRADFLEVNRILRGLGLVLQPTFVPFTPWTTLDGYIELLRVLPENDLIENVAPIQLAIRLLIPAGSRLLELEVVRRLIDPFDPSALVYPWRNRDPRVDALAAEIEGIVAVSEKRKLPRPEIFERIWKTAHEAAGIDAEFAAQPVLASRATIPYLNEPWYC